MNLARSGAPIALAALATCLPASAGESFAHLWQRIQHAPDAERADALEDFLVVWPEERERRLALAALNDALRGTSAPLSPREWWDLEALAQGNAGCQALLIGRHVLVLGTHAFAESARKLDLVRRLDLAWVGLRALHGVDPIAVRRHRVYVFPDPSWSNVLQINRDALRIRLPWERRDDAAMFEPMCHELDHAFVGDHPAEHLKANGFFEGWADFAPVFCRDWLGAIDSTETARARELIEIVRGAGELEYLPTRLSIEEAVGYAPAGALFAELTLAARDQAGAFDWEPWRRLFCERAWLPQPTGTSWAPRLARDLEWAFGSPRATNVLRLWRFLPPLVADASVEVVPRTLPSAAAVGEVWAARGERVLRGWNVLGPIPDAKREGLEHDPLDGALLSDLASPDAAAPREIDGVRIARRDDVSTDAYGTLRLESVPGSRAPSAYYLVREFTADEPPPAEIWLASDDRVIAWLDGVELLRVSEPRRIDVFDATRAFGTERVGRHRLVVLVADEGGTCWIHARTSSKSALATAWREEVGANEAARRAAACASLGTRTEMRTLASELLVGALADSSPDVRRAAALALGGRRNEREVLEAVWKRAQREKDVTVRAALESSLRELLLLSRDAALELDRGFERTADEYAARRWFVEGERALRDGRAIGGFYGAREFAYGAQSFGREWGAEGNWFAVTLVCRERGPRTLALRYTQADRDEAKVALELRRGARTVWSGGVKLPRTNSWSDWRWSEVDLPALDSGAYALHVFATNESASPDFDVVGWR